MVSHVMGVRSANRPHIEWVLWATFLHSRVLSWERHIVFKLIIAGRMDLNDADTWHL
jgi:hypothetical protein